MRLGRDLVQRLSLGVIDQLLSSGSNFVALLLGARYLDAGGFGAYSLALVSYTITLGITRALCSEALLVRPGEAGAERERRTRLVAGSVTWVGLVATVCFAAGALLADGAVVGCLVVLAVTMPALLGQDVLRYAAFSRGQPRAAVISDGTWALGQALGFAFVISRGDPSAPALLLAWSIPGALAGLMQAARERVVPAVERGISWILRNRDLSVRYALDFLSGAGAAQLAAYVLAGVAGVAAVGSIRGAQTLFGPVNILLTGAYIVLVPEGRKAAQRSARSLTLICLTASATFAVAAAVMLGVFLVLSPETGRLVLGNTWDSARSVVVPVGLAAIAGGVLAGAMAGLRSLAAAREILRIRLFTIPTTLALPILGAVGWELPGLAYGIALSVWWNVIWYWNAYRRALLAFEETGEVVEPDMGPLDVDGLGPQATPSV